MILVIQFRRDQSGPHEVKVLHEVGGIPFDHYYIINASSPYVSSVDLVDLARRARGVILGGWGENGYEAETHEAKEDLKQVIEKTTPLIEYLVSSDKLTLGMCFGHQLIADIIGGVVKKDKEQAEAGITEIQLTPEGRLEHLFQDLGEHFYAVVGHKASVLQLPQSAVHLASSEKCTHQAFRIGQHVYGVQFHPELDLNGVEERFDLYPEYRDHTLDFVEGLRVEADKIAKRFTELTERG